MPSKKLQENDSLQAINNAYTQLKKHYEESVEELSRNFDILKHSKANTDSSDMHGAGVLEVEGETDEILDIYEQIRVLKGGYDIIEQLMKPIVNALGNNQDKEPLYGHTGLPLKSSVRVINEMTDKLDNLECRTNKLRQELPIVRKIQNFIRRSGELLGKFCQMFVNLFMTIEPKEEAAKAKASMLAHFDKLRESVNKHKDDIETGEFRHKPDARRESGFEMI